MSVKVKSKYSNRVITVSKESADRLVKLGYKRAQTEAAEEETVKRTRKPRAKKVEETPAEVEEES